MTNNRFSARSSARLAQCHKDLQIIAKQVLQYMDCTVITGHRDKEEQDKMCDAGLSKLRFPFSKHNRAPSWAIDLAPYVRGKGVMWERGQCCFMAGIVIVIARQKNIKLRWGGDWDSDTDLNDQTFNDLIHFELLEENS